MILKSTITQQAAKFALLQDHYTGRLGASRYDGPSSGQNVHYKNLNK